MHHTHRLSMEILYGTMKKVSFWLLAIAIFLPYVGHADQTRVPDVAAILQEANVLAQTPADVFRTGLMSEIAVAQAKRGNYQEAKVQFDRVIQRIKALHFDPHSGFNPLMGVSELLDIALKQEQGGLVDERTQLFTKIIQYAQNIADAETRFFAFQEIAIAQAKMRDPRGIAQTFTRLFTLAEQLQGQKRLVPDYLKIKSIIHLARAYADMEEIETARATINRAM